MKLYTTLAMLGLTAALITVVEGAAEKNSVASFLPRTAEGRARRQVSGYSKQLACDTLCGGIQGGGLGEAGKWNSGPRPYIYVDGGGFSAGPRPYIYADGSGFNAGPRPYIYANGGANAGPRPYIYAQG